MSGKGPEHEPLSKVCLSEQRHREENVPVMSFLEENRLAQQGFS